MDSTQLPSTTPSTPSSLHTTVLNEGSCRSSIPQHAQPILSTPSFTNSIITFESVCSAASTITTRCAKQNNESIQSNPPTTAHLTTFKPFARSSLPKPVHLRPDTAGDGPFETHPQSKYCPPSARQPNQHRLLLSPASQQIRPPQFSGVGSSTTKPSAENQHDASGETAGERPPSTKWTRSTFLAVSTQSPRAHEQIPTAPKSENKPLKSISIKASTSEMSTKNEGDALLAMNGKR